MRKLRLNVRRLLRIVKIALVATEAIARRPLKAIVGMTTVAPGGRMCAGQRKEAVIHRAATPILRGVATATIC